MCPTLHPPPPQKHVRAPICMLHDVCLVSDFCMRQVAPSEHHDDDAWAVTGTRRPIGKVVGVIKRNWRSRGYAGSLQPPREGQAPRLGATSWLVVPVEKRFPFIRIQTRQVCRHHEVAGPLTHL